MAKVQLGYLSNTLTMEATGSDAFVKGQVDAFLAAAEKHLQMPDPEMLSMLPPEEPKRAKAAGAQVSGAAADVVALYDNAGIPSIMRRFRRITNRELFGGSDRVHPAFIIGGEVYDEIYISVYPNTMINGKPYSLPYTVPITGITMDQFADACFSKGEGWHCLTAPEWGLLANTSLNLGTLPHGNTSNGKWHGDLTEKGVNIEGTHKTLAGSGPATWTHDHTVSGVHDLCGNIREFVRGMRINDGALEAARDNDAALPGTDLTLEGDDWQAITDDSGLYMFASVTDAGITFTNSRDFRQDFNSVPWKEVMMDCQSERMKELAMFSGEPDARCSVDSGKGEYMLIRGGHWDNGANAGVFNSDLSNARSSSYGGVGGRSAFFMKH